jgi:O-antigen ligase
LRSRHRRPEPTEKDVEHDVTAPALRTARMDRLETLSLSVLLCFVAALQLSVAASGVLLALTLLCWGALLVLREEQLEVPGFFWPLAAYAAVTLVSTTASVDPGVSLVDSKQLVLFLIVPLVYRLARGHRAHLFASVIIAVGAASALVGLFQYGFLHFDNLGRRPQGALTHYMTYSGALMLVACVAAARLLFGSRDRVWPLLVLPAVLVALGLTFTRSAWVGVCVGLSVLLALRDRRLVAAVPLALAVAVVLAPATITDRVYSIFDMKDPTNRDRMAMLKSGAAMVEDHPLTGVGPDQVKAVYRQYRVPESVQPLNVHLHNVPMQIAAERGLPALIVWLWFVVTVARDLYRRVQYRTGVTRALAAGALASLTAMLGAGLFEYNFGDSEFLMLLLVVLTLPFAAERPESVPRPL